MSFAFEGRESSRVPDVLEETVPDVGTKVREYIYIQKPWVLW